MANLDIAVLVSSYQRPRHLIRVLSSLAGQVGVDGRFEVVVTDDGSTDETPTIVREFAAAAGFPVGFTTHKHETFQLARCRNEGVRASSAPYLLFLDGDCLAPPDHLWQHLAARRPGVVHAGYCVHLDQATSDRIDVEMARRGEFVAWADPDEMRKLRRMHRKSRLYNLLRHPTKPKMFGGNVGLHRGDYEDVNGYDEQFEGWGCEDDDLRLRLRQAGKRIRSILGRTRTYHLWHPPGSTTPNQWRRGANVEYLRRRDRPIQCQHGLYKLADDASDRAA